LLNHKLRNTLSGAVHQAASGNINYTGSMKQWQCFGSVGGGNHFTSKFGTIQISNCNHLIALRIADLINTGKAPPGHDHVLRTWVF